MNITHIDGYQAVMINRNVYRLTQSGQGTVGTIGLCLLLNRAGRPDQFALVWQWGGDWNVFLESMGVNLKEVGGWEPHALREAAAEAFRIAPECESDMEWYSDLADQIETLIAEVEADEG